MAAVDEIAAAAQSATADIDRRLNTLVSLMEQHTADLTMMTAAVNKAAAAADKAAVAADKAAATAAANSGLASFAPSLPTTYVPAPVPVLVETSSTPALQPFVVPKPKPSTPTKCSTECLDDETCQVTPTLLRDLSFPAILSLRSESLYLLLPPMRKGNEQQPWLPPTQMKVAEDNGERPIPWPSFKQLWPPPQGKNHCWLNAVDGIWKTFNQEGIYLFLLYQSHETLDGDSKHSAAFRKLKYLHQRYPHLNVFAMQYGSGISSSTQSQAVRTIMEEYITFPILLSDKDFTNMTNGAGYLLFEGSKDHILFAKLDGDPELMIRDIERFGALSAVPSENVLESGVPWQKEEVVKEPYVGSLRNLLLYHPGGVLVDEDGDRIFISDSNHQSIIISNSDGVILDCIGSSPGFEDGDFESKLLHPATSFSHAAEDCLYIVDSENHAITNADFGRRFLETVYPVFNKKGSGLWSWIIDKLGLTKKEGASNIHGASNNPVFSIPYFSTELGEYSDTQSTLLQPRQSIIVIPLDKGLLAPWDPSLHACLWCCCQRQKICDVLEQFYGGSSWDVTITQVLYPVTEKVLGQVFDPYDVKEICVVQQTAQLVRTQQATYFLYVEQLLASRLSRQWDPGGSKYTCWVLNYKYFDGDTKVYFRNMRVDLNVWENDKFRVISIELYVQWDPGIMKVLLMLAIFWENLQSILGPDFCPRTSKDDHSLDGITLSQASDQHIVFCLPSMWDISESLMFQFFVGVIQAEQVGEIRHMKCKEESEILENIQEKFRMLPADLFHMNFRAQLLASDDLCTENQLISQNRCILHSKAWEDAFNKLEEITLLIAGVLVPLGYSEAPA